MPSTPPAGEPAPDDGSLPAGALDGAGDRLLGAYVHVPFCATRCGYCDFNTYTAGELGDPAAPAAWLDASLREVQLAARILGPAGRPLSTVFIGGGTPTLLPPAMLRTVLASLDDSIGLAGDAEVTTEANPESVTPASLQALADAGVNRISFGMQSGVERVLAALDRRHTSGRVAEAVGWARDAGIGQVSVDLIYGAPGETDADWAASLEAALALEPDHVSAYALVVEQGTRLARQVRRGEVQAPDDDALADRYEAAVAAFGAAGLKWYEVSNWARHPDAQCRHNLGYWRGDDWWGVGPGAHSHVGGTRWWNVRHPAAYAQRLAEGCSPAHAREVLDADSRRLETVLLGVRLADGLALDAVPGIDNGAALELADDGLLEPAALDAGRAVLTLRGRLLADTVVRALTGD